jgi:hypothetical protein
VFWKIRKITLRGGEVESKLLKFLIGLGMGRAMGKVVANEGGGESGDG